MSCYASSLSVCINVFYDRFLDGLVKAIRQKPQQCFWWPRFIAVCDFIDRMNSGRELPKAGRAARS